jgi:hypothetical protein
VLVGVDDVESRVGEEAADPRDQARPVWAGEQQPGCLVVGDRRIMMDARTASSFQPTGPEI